MEKSSRSRSEMFTGVTHVEMLEELAEGRKAEAKDWYLRCKLKWHDKAKTFFRHVRYGEQELDAQEQREIEAAYIRFHADKIEARREENRKDYDTLRSTLALLETVDPDFHRPAIEAIRDVADRLGNLISQARTED